MFMQNIALIHSARKTKAWFEEMNIKVMKWLPYSPNLNLIENLWALLKKKAFKVYPDLASLKDKDDEAETKLFEILQQVWSNIREEVIEWLIAIKAEGWHEG